MKNDRRRFGIIPSGAVLAMILTTGAITGPAAYPQQRCDAPSAKSEAGSNPENRGFYCNPNALTPAEHARHKQLSEQLSVARVETKELTDGFAFRMQSGAVSLADLAEWVAAESKCCPFFEFEIQLEAGNGPLWLKLRGEEGIKRFIVVEFHVR